MIALLENAAHQISRIIWLICALALLLLILLTTEQVLARYFFKSSSIGLQELEWHLFGFIFLMGAATTLEQDKHVRVDILYSRLKPRGKSLINIIGNTFFLLPTVGVIIYFGIEDAMQAREFVHTEIEQFSFFSNLYQFQVFISLDEWIDHTLLAGESSPDPGGLRGRWLIKALIPLSGILLLFQSLRLLTHQILIFLDPAKIQKSDQEVPRDF